MGDIADDMFDQGEDDWLRHLTGICDQPCPYCDYEYEREERAFREMTRLAEEHEREQRDN